MNTGMDEFQYLLQDMRSKFLDDLQERCDRCDNLLIGLEKKPDDRELLDGLFRAVHDLKGVGGSHGLFIVTSICHQLEISLADVAAKGDFQKPLERAFKYIDLLRRVDAPGRTENPDYSSIEADLEELRQSALQSRKSCLIAESSTMMVRVCQNALADRSIQFTIVNNGLDALSRLVHERFDLLIIGRELKDLNGIAVIAALRASQGKNQNLPVILVTSNLENIPEHAGINAILPKNNRLSAGLIDALQKMQM